MHVANVHTCGPLLIPPPPPPTLKCWEHPKRHGLCSQSAHLWATTDFVPCSEALGTPLDGMGYVANLPTCGPLLILSPTLKRWRPP